MKKHISILMAIVGVLIVASTSWALTITTETLPQWTGTDNSNLNNDQIATIVGYGGTLDLLYKQDVGAGSDTGSFASSYSTVFDNTPTDPKDATISNVSGPFISGTPIYLYVKDGNAMPAYYIFDISAWNGNDTIYLEDFWPNRGAISHVAIYGTAAVPEPATLILLGLGLLGIAGIRRKK